MTIGPHIPGNAGMEHAGYCTPRVRRHREEFVSLKSVQDPSTGKVLDRGVEDSGTCTRRIYNALLLSPQVDDDRFFNNLTNILGSGRFMENRQQRAAALNVTYLQVSYCIQCTTLPLSLYFYIPVAHPFCPQGASGRPPYPNK